MFRIIYHLIFLGSLLLLPQAGKSIDHPSSFNINQEKWKQLTNDKAFDYKTEIEATPKKTQPSQNYLSKILKSIIDFFSSPAGRWLVWLILAGIIIYAIIRIVLGNRGMFAKAPKKIKETTSLNELPVSEDLLSTDWEEKIQLAFQQGEYRLAVRYSYLALLQYLQAHQQIIYRPEKTNQEYYYELKNVSVKPHFRQLTRQYEYCWYGNHPVEEKQLSGYLEEFKLMKSKV
jgi:hypothetical protein